MRRSSGFNLKSVLKEIGKLKASLRVHKGRVTPAGRHAIDLKLRDLDNLRTFCQAMCPKSWGTWPQTLESKPARRKR